MLIYIGLIWDVILQAGSSEAKMWELKLHCLALSLLLPLCQYINSAPCRAFKVMCKTLEPPLITLHFSFKEPRSFLVMYLVLQLIHLLFAEASSGMTSWLLSGRQGVKKPFLKKAICMEKVRREPLQASVKHSRSYVKVWG